MLEAPGRLLPRPMSLCLAPPGELAFLIEPLGRGTRALCALRPGEAIHVLGPLGNGFDLDVPRPLLVGGGVGIAPLPYLSEALGAPRRCSASAAGITPRRPALLPGAEVVIDPVLVTEIIPPGHDILACGPEPMLRAIERIAPDAQLAWEAPMACGYGACYGCAVEIDGQLEAALRGGARAPTPNGGASVKRLKPTSGSDKRHVARRPRTQGGICDENETARVDALPCCAPR